MARVPGSPEEYGKAVRDLIDEGRRLTAAEFYQAHRDATDAAAEQFASLRTGQLDAILSPTLGLAPMAIDDVPNFLQEDWGVYTQFLLPVSFARLPAIAVPAGHVSGLPVSVQLIGRYGGELQLLELAEELENMPGFGFSQPPEPLLWPPSHSL